jgi:thiol-disulfide isomerase/thioredoxin
MKLRSLLHAVVVAAVAVSIAAVGGAQQGPPPKVMRWQGKPLPRIHMKSISGRTITNRTLRGKVVVIDFWATWCGPCKAASPIMQKMHAKYGSRGLVVIGADVWERAETRNPAQNYAKGHGYTYTFTVKNDDLAKTLGLQGIPTMLIVDRHGKIARVVVGYDSRLESMLDTAISKLL